MVSCCKKSCVVAAVFSLLLLQPVLAWSWTVQSWTTQSWLMQVAGEAMRRSQVCAESAEPATLAAMQLRLAQAISPPVASHQVMLGLMSQQNQGHWVRRLWLAVASQPSTQIAERGTPVPGLGCVAAGVPVHVAVVPVRKPLQPRRTLLSDIQLGIAGHSWTCG